MVPSRPWGVPTVGVATGPFTPRVKPVEAHSSDTVMYVSIVVVGGDASLSLYPTDTTKRTSPFGWAIGRHRQFRLTPLGSMKTCV
jgi:hypothetical protein